MHDLATRFDDNRARLRAVAYRTLGSTSEVETTFEKRGPANMAIAGKRGIGGVRVEAA
jgi:hypothetical protein